MTEEQSLSEKNWTMNDDLKAFNLAYIQWSLFSWQIKRQELKI